MHALIEKYLHGNNYFNIPSADLKLQLISHPDSHSIKSITDTLDYFKIDNIAVNVPKDSLNDLPAYFLAVLEGPEGKGYAIATRKKDHVFLYYEDTSTERLTPEAFKEKWTGTIVAVEETKQQKKQSVTFPYLPLVLAAIAFITVQAVSFDLVTSLLSLLSVAGIYLSYMIVKEEVGIHSKNVAKVCSAVSKSGKCADVINAKSGRLFNFFLLSDACISFFIASALIYSLLGINFSFLQIITWAAIPVVLFSFYQQALVLKQWCALCLAIAGVLLIQGAIVFFFSTPDYSLPYSLKAGFIFLITYLAWVQIKLLLISDIKLPKVQAEFLRFKRNQNLFQTLLRKNPVTYTNLISEEYEISFGAASPKITIDAVTNPLCGFCVDAFKAYHQVLNSHKDDVRVNFIFSVPFEQADNKATQIASRVIEIYTHGGKEKAMEALSEWYNHRNVEQWQQQYGLPDAQENHTNAVLASHKNWCALNEIGYTPATIIDNHVFPDEYKTTDLSLMMGDMIVEKTTKLETEPIMQG